MINKTRCLFYEVGGAFFKDIKDAQKADLISLMPQWDPLVKDSTADWLLAVADKIVDTLSTTPKSRLRARKSHGAVRKKKTEKPTCAAPGQT